MSKTLFTIFFILLSTNVHADTTKDIQTKKIVDDLKTTLREIREESLREIEKNSKSIPVDIEGIVVNIADGDTLTVLDSNNIQHKIRINSIDAPELGQAFGRAAKEMLSEFCFNKKAMVKKIDVDRYDRVVGDVRCGDRGQHFVSGILVKKGMSWVYDKYVRDDYLYLYSLQKSAQDAQLGLWADRNPVPPWDWRKSKK